MAAFRLLANGVLRTGDGAMIPEDPRNKDYRKFLAFVRSGNVPDPLIEETPIADAELLTSRLGDPVLSALVDVLAEKTLDTRASIIEKLRTRLQGGAP